MGYAKEHLSESDLARIARDLFEVTEPNENKGELHGLCPIHQEKNPSFSYNYKKDKYFCFSCSASGDLIKLWSHVKGLDDGEGFKTFCRFYGIAASKPSAKATAKDDTAGAPRPPSKRLPPPDKVSGPAGHDPEDAWRKFPSLPAEWCKRLEDLCGWLPETLKALDIRQQTHYRHKKSGNLVRIKKPERIAIPIRDLTGKLVNIRLYKPGAKKMKILSWGKGFGSSRLFPAKPKDTDGPVLLCEGEKDTLCALSLGFNAITQTSKLKNWPDEQRHVFKDRDVVIAYDADLAGQKYADYAAHCLNGVAKTIRLLIWPDFMGRKDDGTWPKDKGQDLTDLIIKHGKSAQDLQNLIDGAMTWKDPNDIPPDVARFFEIGISGRPAFKPRKLAEEIMKETELVRDPASEMLFRWNGTYWEPYDESHIEKVAMDHLQIEAQKARIKDAAYQVLTASTLPHDRQLNDRPDWVCLKNCMLNLFTLETRPHSRDFYCTVALPVEFDLDTAVDCLRWRQFWEETVQTAAAINQVQEFFGYCLTRSTRFQKCLLLLGPGSDGKSIAINILRNLVGEENTSSVAFEDLEDQFLRSSLFGKLLNVSTEVKSKAMETPFFKAIVAGDAISAAYKHKNTFSFRPYAKLVYSANKVPRVKDNSDGYFRRLLPVTFKQQFDEHHPNFDPDLEEKLMKELSGIFKWALAGLHRLIKQKGFTQCDETLETLQGYRRLNNPVACFVEDECLLGDEMESDKKELYQKFRSYCGTFGYNPFNYENFLRELYAAVSNLRQVRKTLGNGKRKRVIKGIAINDVQPAGE